MNNPVKKRIEQLRDMIRQEKISAFIIPSTDPHMSEYVAPHWQAREYFSGFTGSAGTLVVTPTEAGLWTDSRYFLQAAEQLKGSGIDLYKEGLPETPDIPTFLTTHTDGNLPIGYDPEVFSYSAAEQLHETLEKQDFFCVHVYAPYKNAWKNRPALPDGKAYIYKEEYAGQSCAEKLGILRRLMAEQSCNFLLLAALDEIAWTLNIRGNDIHCNPLVVSYLLVGAEKADLFIDSGKTDRELCDYLADNGVETHPYQEFWTRISHLTNERIWADPDKSNEKALFLLPETCDLMTLPSPVTKLKAVRNETEIQGLHRAMQRDGVALVKFLKWLEEAVPQGGQTEISVSRKLQELRAAQPLYMGESFDTIAGYREHGAIVHYEATPDTDAPLRAEGFLLLDSGAQYLDGTTDITRTIALGPLTEEEKRDYTLILKGHIALAQAVFPEGTRGAQLDALARIPLWKHGMNFLHGTGHGVGHFLNVHEGPQSIRMNENPVVLQAGMLTSNEPGVYKAGCHGIRTENLMLAVPAGEGMFGRYLRFETVTLCPIDTQGIVREMLNNEETDWLNDYHRRVYELLAPDLDEAERSWLAGKCQAI